MGTLKFRAFGTDVIFTMFGRAIFEVFKVKGGRIVKEDFEAEKNLNKSKKINLVFMSHGLFLPTRNRLKSTITTKNLITVRAPL